MAEAKTSRSNRYDGSTDLDKWAAMRDRRILDASRRLIGRGGLRSLTRKAIAEEAEISPATVNNFGRTSTQRNYRPAEGYRERVLAALMADAIDKADIAMIRVGVADGCLRCEDVPEALRVLAGV